jgi:hypothetical protein
VCLPWWETDSLSNQGTPCGCPYRILAVSNPPPTGSFDPQNLTTAASLNRVHLAGLPGVRLEEGDIIGKTGFELLSADALSRYIQASADRLLLINASPAELPFKLNAYFVSTNPAIRETAEAVAQRYGHYLGYLIAVLKRGDPINREARPEWDDSYWQHWAGIRQVKLGGGIVSGHLGPLAVTYAMQALASASVNDCTISLSEHPTYLPMIGAARSAPAGTRTMAVFDFGSTLTKSAYAFYDSGKLVSLRALPGERTQVIMGLHGVDRTHSLADFMVHSMTRTWQQAHHMDLDPASTIVATLASYIKNGRPDPTQAGYYGELRHIAPNIETWFSQRLTGRLGRPISVTFLHDGTAAARTYAGNDAHHIAVITLGTALGVGYPPSSEGLRPIAANFSVT